MSEGIDPQLATDIFEAEQMAGNVTYTTSVELQTLARLVLALLAAVKDLQDANK